MTRKVYQILLKIHFDIFFLLGEHIIEELLNEQIDIVINNILEKENEKVE